MFTGIIEAEGSIQSIRNNGNDSRIKIHSGNLDLSDVSLGDSIATNGVCLTVVELGDDFYCADVSAETIKYTGFAHYQVGTVVNLEKALQVGGRLGGHMVSGHVDGIGEISGINHHADYIEFWVNAPAELAKYIAHKGSITVDGISLTVNKVEKNAFMLWIIPHTLQVTTMRHYVQGSKVNLEVDLIARYLERLLSGSEVSKNSGIDQQFLVEHGFAKP